MHWGLDASKTTNSILLGSLRIPMRKKYGSYQRQWNEYYQQNNFDQGTLYVDGRCASISLLSKTLLKIIIQWFLTFSSTILEFMKIVDMMSLSAQYTNNVAFFFIKY